MNLRLTLRFRIISLIALFAIVLITVFTVLLMTRQLRVITENNQYRARIGTFAAKGAFERALHASLRAGNPPAAFQKLIPFLQEGQLTEDVRIADLKGEVVASAQPALVGTPLSWQESEGAEYARKTYSPKTWFRAQVNPGEVIFYTPITLDDSPRYIAIFCYSLGNIKDAIRQAARLCLLVALGVIATIIPLCLILIRAILRPIQILNRATKDIAAGNVGQKVVIPTEDELAELAGTFNVMTSALVRMKERAENANPLTKLPGNNVIHDEIEKRIQGNVKFVAIYSDLDNFKAFNDKYGIGAGDQAIRLTAQILREAIQKGSPGDFLGHEGGDDFLLLTTPEKTDPVANEICAAFDRQIQELYSPEDKAQGYIVSKDREGNEKRFPIMTISLAGVTNAHRPLTSYAEVTNICAEVKKKAKMMSKTSGKSSFYLDKRTGAAEEAHAEPPPAAPPTPPKAA